MPWASFISRKLETAQRLNAGCCGAGYPEATILVAHVVSGIAADIWPGERIDRKRFVQLWSIHCDASLGATKISIPLLVEDLRKAGDTASAEKIETSRPKMFGSGYATRVLTGDDVDTSEKEVLAIIPTMTLRSIRASSYGALFYRHVRSGLAHEFHLTESATQHPMTRRLTSGVSYSNLASHEDRDVVRRVICFDFSWLVEVARSIASHFDSSAGPAEQNQPPQWWIEGG